MEPRALMASPSGVAQDSGILRRIALQSKPDAEFEGEIYAIAVLPHTKSHHTCIADDFLWFKVKSKHTVEKLRGAYAKSNPTQVEFRYNGRLIDDATKVRDLNDFRDNVVLFTAHPLSGGDSMPNSSMSSQGRKPLEPINTQLPATPNQIGANVVKPLIKNENPHSGGLSTTSDAPAFGTSPMPNTSTVKAERENQDTPLQDEHSVEEEEEEEEKPTHHSNRLQKLIETASADALEAEVRSTKAFLATLREPLDENVEHSKDAQHWVQHISNLQNHKVDTPTIIGVVGNTGAGKSSVINAILDEERLVPTNCMRACTAVVTEMSWNSSDNPSSKYRAEIAFIDPQSWKRDLEMSLAEFKDENGGVSRECHNPDSEAGIAYAKIKAVYPLKTNEMLARSSIEDLMSEPAVKAVLGTTKSIDNSRPELFYKALQHYVDSKEKSTGGKKNKKDKAEKKEMEFWPLIKVVRIFTKAEALSTGAILVDLPGVHDSNAARAAVAAGYLKQCTGLWIVAPIGRAVDDKSAKTLMGEAFKRQLKYDGTYSRITFICSKTDDISITEATDSLGIDEEMAADWERIDSINNEKKFLKQTLKGLQESRVVYTEMMSDADDLLDIWEALKEELEDGKTIYAPSSKKRKRSPTPSKPRKKSKKQTSKGSDDEDDFINVDEDHEEEENSSDDENDSDTASQKGDPLTKEAIDEKIAEYKDNKKKARRERLEIDTKSKKMNEDLMVLEKKKGAIEAAMSSVCIAGRNTYSKGAIQTDFAAGIKELDQENAQEQDEENFDPDQDIRDYDEVARSLPVFCVSSRAYQKLSGRMQRDADVPGFRTAEETEIPQLKAHCKKLTEGGRASNCRRFLTDLSQFLNSLSLWASHDGTGLNMSESQMAAESRFLHSKLQALDKSLEKAVKECLEDMKQTLAENIFDDFDNLVQKAVDEANLTATRWGDRNNGGFYWATYKALCRRQGVFANANGAHDLNLQLTEPIIKGLASSWEKAFARRLPNVLQSFQRKNKSLLFAFHREIEARCMKQGLGVVGMAMLSHQLQNYEQNFIQLTHQMVEVITERQREANREFTPVIAESLASSYEFCAAETGRGQYVRMKAHMVNHIDVTKSDMFDKSVGEVRKRLNAMCKVVEEHMANKADEVWTTMNRDYTQVVSGTTLPDGEQMPKWERHLRADVAKAIKVREQKLEEAEARRIAQEAKNANVAEPKTVQPIQEVVTVATSSAKPSEMDVA